MLLVGRGKAETLAAFAAGGRIASERHAVKIITIKTKQRNRTHFISNILLIKRFDYWTTVVVRP